MEVFEELSSGRSRRRPDYAEENVEKRGGKGDPADDRMQAVLRGELPSSTRQDGDDADDGAEGT